MEQIFTAPSVALQPIETSYQDTRMRDIALAQVLDYGKWVASTWPNDALALMAGQRDDADTARGHELYFGELGKRALQVRAGGAMWTSVATDPGSFASSEISPTGAYLSTQTKTLADQVAANEDAAPTSMWDSYNLSRAWAERKAQLGITSWQEAPAAFIASIIKPLLLPLVIVGLLILVWKMPSFAGLKVGGKKKGR